ncbi:MAG: hypothetical protein ACYS8Z_24745 [Planctomycetota bacterium]
MSFRRFVVSVAVVLVALFMVLSIAAEASSSAKRAREIDNVAPPGFVSLFNGRVASKGPSEDDTTGCCSLYGTSIRSGDVNPGVLDALSHAEGGVYPAVYRPDEFTVKCLDIGRWFGVIWWTVRHDLDRPGGARNKDFLPNPYLGDVADIVDLRNVLHIHTICPAYAPQGLFFLHNMVNTPCLFRGSQGMRDRSRPRTSGEQKDRYRSD